MKKVDRIRERARFAIAVGWVIIPIHGGSLKASTRDLLPIGLGERRRRAWGWVRRIGGRIGPLGYAALLALPFLPFLNVDWGPLGSEHDSSQYLQTMWQVVAAALGLSIAMVGFVFEAFMNAASRNLGGTLREFARTTRLQAALGVGFAALIVDGMVLLGLGHQAPGGWAAACAIATSAITLGVALPFVFRRTLRGFEFEYLVGLRRRKIEEIVHQAMELQLRGQAGDAIVHQARNSGVGRGLWPSPSQQVVTAKHAGVVRDVKLGPLRRLGKLDRSAAASVDLLVPLNERVAAGRAVLAVPPTTSNRWRWAARRSVRVRRRWLGASDPSAELAEELAKLHEAAKSAIREQRKGDWQLIGEIYSSALLTMPRAAGAMNVSFGGAVASPGLLGLGPLDRIQRFLSDEISTALEVGDRELALEVAYFPAHVAHDALEANAPGLVGAMLSLYPTLYAVATRP